MIARVKQACFLFGKIYAKSTVKHANMLAQKTTRLHRTLVDALTQSVVRHAAAPIPQTVDAPWQPWTRKRPIKRMLAISRLSI
jgi:hypothetical protein